MAEVDVLAPVAGRVVPLDHVPDPMFATAMVGPGLAIDPDPAQVEVRSPIAGVVGALHPHAFVVAAGTADGDRAVLVHLGIDTVHLKGEGFTLHVAQGEDVTAGQLLITWSPPEIVAAGYSALVPVIALAAEADCLAMADSDVAVGDRLFRWGC